MESLADSDLLHACVERMWSRLDAREESALRGWAEETGQRAAPLVSALLARRETEWERLILTHRAHRHAWYDELAHCVSIREFAAFLLENWAFPAFLPLLERTRQAQICDEGRAAIRRNLEDEQIPIPHAGLMRRLIDAVKAKAGEGVRLASYPSLVDRTLVFYYGYYCDPWHLVGSLYATEVMTHHRVTHMGVGLVRLGIEPADLEFIRIHSVCDEDHARDWREGVIAPSVRSRPPLRVSIAEGTRLVSRPPPATSTTSLRGRTAVGAWLRQAKRATPEAGAREEAMSEFYSPTNRQLQERHSSSCGSRRGRSSSIARATPTRRRAERSPFRAHARLRDTHS